MVNKVIFFGFILRVAVAIWNGYFGPSFGADLDAVSFHNLGVAYSHDLVLDQFRIGWIYSFFLGFFYYLFAPTVFFGSFLSCFAWLLSAMLLKKVVRFMAYDREQSNAVLLVFALYPSSILFTSVTLREAYQLLFVNLAFYGAVRIYIKKDVRAWGWVVLGGAGMGVLHGGLLALGLYMASSTLVLLSLRNKKLSMRKLLVFLPIALIVILLGISIFAKFSYNLEGGISSAVESYQQGGISTVARANYKDDVQIGGGADFLLSLPISLFQYLFEPMPWRISSLADIALAFENVLRGWLIWRSYSGLKKSPTNNWPVVFAFLAYSAAELIWSLGTVNWGTAARHHIPSLGLLAVSAFATKEQFKQKNKARRILQRVS